MRSNINQASLEKCKIATLLCLGLMLVPATLQNYSQEILARCPNGYHKSPSGDCEKVGGSNGSKKCSSGYHKDENTGKCKKVGDEKTLTQKRVLLKVLDIHKIKQICLRLRS